MSMEIKARELLAAGWAGDDRLGTALRRARELEAGGLSRTEALAALEQEIPKQARRIQPRTAPMALSEAIDAETPEEKVNLEQVRARMNELLHSPVLQRGAVMPDACPSGAGKALIPVGGGIIAEKAILPGAHSSDICCSLFASFFPANHPIGEIMDHVQKITHFGPGGRPKGDLWWSPVLDEPVWSNPYLAGTEDKAREHLGTQGDGNHFTYVGRIEFTPEQQRALADAGHHEVIEGIGKRDGVFNVLVTHHGSRALGAEVYRRGHEAAAKWCRRHADDVPEAAMWIPTDIPEGAAYWDALQYVSRWTRENHALIHENILRRLGQRAAFQLHNEHNFVWKRGDLYYHGKGATPAWRDARGRPLIGLIPLNMAREILIVMGADNDRYLSFCPHGAGRNQSRSAMLRPYRDITGRIDPARVQQVMSEVTAGLDIRWACGGPDLSESPLGYKDAAKVKAQIEKYGLATVVGEIRPQGSLMAGEAAEKPWERARREKKARHKEERREGRAEAEG